MRVKLPTTYDGYWLLPCSGCGQKYLCNCFPPPTNGYQRAMARVLPREGEKLYDVATDPERAKWPSL